MNPYITEALNFFRTLPDDRMILVTLVSVVVLGMAFTLLILMFYCLPKHIIDLIMHRIDRR